MNEMIEFITIKTKDVGSNPTVYWMDVSDASYYIVIEKKKNKGSQITPKKYLKKTIKTNVIQT
jgi:hypothetical protein